MSEQCFQVGEFFLDPANRLLRHGDVSVSLSPKAFDALVYLARNPRRLLTREELIEALWPDSYVEEGNLSVHIFQVRKALGLAPDGKTYIQTVPKKGYRFNAPVTPIDPRSHEPEPHASGMPESPPERQLPSPCEADKPDSANGGALEVGSLSEGSPQPASTAAPVAQPESTPPRTSLHAWKLVAGGAACVMALLVAIAIHFALNPQVVRMPARAMRLTSFSPELSVSGSAISPDGKTLAYANPAGVFLEEIATKEARRLQVPVARLSILGLSWFADGSRLLATAAETDAPMISVWIVPAKGASEPERVGDFLRGVISPDSTQIALLREDGGVKQLFLLPTGGGQLRRIAMIPTGEDPGSIFWSADGRRLFYVALRWDPQLRTNRGFIRSIDLSNGRIEELLSRPNLSGEAIRLPDGRWLYGQLLGANPAGSYGGELREARMDSGTGKIADDSVSLGRWTDQIMSLSSSADGRVLVFRTVLSQHTVYEGDLDRHRESLSQVRRLTFGRGREDFPRAWIPDSKAIFFDSNRNGKWEIFKQALDQMSDEPYVQSSDDDFGPRMSPDGQSLLYLDRPREWHGSEPVRLMRVPIADRFPQLVLQTSGYSEWGLRFDCGRSPGAPCFMAQRVGAEIAFRRFDPERGFEANDNEVLRVPLDSKQKISWALAPDGSRLAWIVSDAPNAIIHVVSLRHSGLRRMEPQNAEATIVVKDLSQLHALSWSPDGKGWYVTTRLPASWRLFYTDGLRTRALWRGYGEYSPEAWPSPDGRHVAFSELEQDSNVWMLHNF